MTLRVLSLMLVLAVPSVTLAATLMQRTAVGSCQVVEGGDEIEFDGSSYLVPSNAEGVLFHCPIDAALAAPGGIARARVWVGDPSAVEDATAQICFTNLNSTPSETCGDIVASAGAGYFAQTLTPLPPPGVVVTRSHAAFLKVYVPSPDPNGGYGFFRGFRIE
jgi:hypothetical protein